MDSSVNFTSASEMYLVHMQSDHVMRVDDEYAVDAASLVTNISRFSAVHMNHSRRYDNDKSFKQ